MQVACVVTTEVYLCVCDVPDEPLPEPELSELELSEPELPEPELPEELFEPPDELLELLESLEIVFVSSSPQSLHVLVLTPVEVVVGSVVVSQEPQSCS